MNNAWGDMKEELFKFQYDNTLRFNQEIAKMGDLGFKFQYDNTLRN